MCVYIVNRNGMVLGILFCSCFFPTEYLAGSSLGQGLRICLQHSYDESELICIIPLSGHCGHFPSSNILNILGSICSHQPPVTI